MDKQTATLNILKSARTFKFKWKKKSKINWINNLFNKLNKSRDSPKLWPVWRAKCATVQSAGIDTSSISNNEKQNISSSQHFYGPNQHETVNKWIGVGRKECAMRMEMKLELPLNRLKSSARLLLVRWSIQNWKWLTLSVCQSHAHLGCFSPLALTCWCFTASDANRRPSFGAHAATFALSVRSNCKTVADCHTASAPAAADSFARQIFQVVTPSHTSLHYFTSTFYSRFYCSLLFFHSALVCIFNSFSNFNISFQILMKLIGIDKLIRTKCADSINFSFENQEWKCLNYSPDSTTFLTLSLVDFNVYP